MKDGNEASVSERNYALKLPAKNHRHGEAHGVRKRSGLKNVYTVTKLLARVASAFCWYNE